MTFSLVGSRLKERAKTQKRLPSSMSIPPYTLHNNIDTKLIILNTSLESIRGTVHVLVMSSGTSSLSKTQ